ncbi:MAG: NDP-sugar synthase [Sphaerochaetaceae bacterium]|nr:NDP-sugar synthase [Sphaerochaetaceae bacterium]
MKAVFDFTRIPKLEVQDQTFDHSSPFLPVMGKPFIQHILEYVERLGLRQWEIYLSNSADEVENFIGDGERWGVSLSYHLLKKETGIGSRIRMDLKNSPQETFLFCNDEFLPLITKEQLLKEQCFSSKNGTDTRWKVTTLSSLEQENPSLEVDTLSVESAGAYLESVRRVISSKGKGLIVYGKEIREGIWAGPGTKIPDTSTLVAPVYLGSQVRIDSQSIIGPNVEIGSGCIIGSDSFISDSSILEGSYVGSGLDVKGCIVKQNKIYNTRIGAVYRATDEILVTSVESSAGIQDIVPVPFASRVLACLFMVITLPVLALLALFTRVKYHRTVVLIPQREMNISRLKTQVMTIFKKRSETGGNLWKHVLWHLIPQLYLVVTGKARFFGVPYKTVQEYERLSPEWQKLYLQSIPGLISESDIMYEQYPEDQLLFASEMYYHAMDSLSYNRALFFRYLKRLFTVKADTDSSFL